jgi:DNA primase
MSNLVDLVKEDYGIQGSGRWFRSEVHSSLVIDAEKEIFYFNARGLSGNALDYLCKVRGLQKGFAQEMLKNAAVGMPIDTGNEGLQVKFEKLVDLFHSSGRNDRAYWYKRLITDSTIDRYRLGNYDGWNLIPIYDKGLFINFQCRRDEPSKKIRFWYKDKDFKPVLFNSDVLKFVDVIYIVEGMVDCLLLNQLGLPSVCSTNGADSWNTGWIRYFTKIKEIFYIPDNDEGGIVGANRVANTLGSSRVKIFRFKEEVPKFGALNYFVKGGIVKDFKELLRDSSVYGFERDLI